MIAWFVSHKQMHNTYIVLWPDCHKLNDGEGQYNCYYSFPIVWELGGREGGGLICSRLAIYTFVYIDGL